MTIDRERLRELADKATPGPWHVVGPPWLASDMTPYVVAGNEDPDVGHFLCDLDNMGGEAPRNAHADAEFIAACDPDTIRALLDHLDKVEALINDEGWFVGGVWGDYGEPVIPVRVLAEALGQHQTMDQTSGSEYANTINDLREAAERAEAERDALRAAVERVRAECNLLDSGVDAVKNHDFGRGVAYAVTGVRSALTLDAP